MNIVKFKSELKEVLANNPQKMNFIIKGYGQLENYATKREFGLRLLELFADENVVDLFLSVAKEKGCFGTFTSDFKWVLRNIPTRLETLEFHINTVKDVEATTEQEKNMTLIERAIRNFGTNA